MSKVRAVMITTYDNPYDPSVEFDKWYQFDIAHGYNSCGLLSRFAITSNGFSDADNDAAIERAIDEIVELHNNKVYKKLVVEIDEEPYVDPSPMDVD